MPCILSYGGTVDLMTFLTLQQLSLHGDPHKVIQAFLLESPHSGTAFYDSNGPAELYQLPCPTTCSTGVGLGAGFTNKGPSPHFHLQSLWLDYFSPPPSQASSTTSHWAILLCQPLESCFLTFPCVFPSGFLYLYANGPQMGL